MSVRDQLVQLAEVGLTDQKLKALRERQKLLPQKAEEAQKKAEQFSEKEKSIDTKHAEINQKRRKFEMDLQNEKTNLRKWESRAEKIRGEREYAALMSEIGSQKKAISDVETQILETLEAQESLEKELASVKKTADSARQVQATEWAAVKEEVDALEREINGLLLARAKLAEKVPASLLKRYEQIALRRAGIGIAVVKREVCQACSRTIPPELFLRISKGEVIEQCPFCNRFLVTEEMSFAEIPHETDV